MNRTEFRSSVLFAYGASLEATRELLDYNANPFQREQVAVPKQLPLTAELHVEAWERYLTQAQHSGAYATLTVPLVQLHFPIRPGISRTDTYRAATLNGAAVVDLPDATGLHLKCPDQIRLSLYQSLAGKIPILTVGEREDFVALVQALARRNEPDPIPASMGACIIAGYNNWDRILMLRQLWEAEHPADCSEANWSVEFLSNVVPHAPLYQDTFIILSEGPYSNVSAAEMGLSEEDWRRRSLSLRLEHECTHYFTRRVFASMRNNMLDELIADYRGIVAARGRYQASWFLRFIGLHAFPDYRASGRLSNYRGHPPLSDEAFKILQVLVKAAAENLERFDHQHAADLETPEAQARLLMALSLLTLEELGSSEADSFIQRTLHTL